MSAHKPTGKREEIDLPKGSRYVRRDKQGHFTEDQVANGASLNDRGNQRK